MNDDIESNDAMITEDMKSTLDEQENADHSDSTIPEGIIEDPVVISADPRESDDKKSIESQIPAKRIKEVAFKSISIFSSIIVRVSNKIRTTIRQKLNAKVKADSESGQAAIDNDVEPEQTKNIRVRPKKSSKNNDYDPDSFSERYRRWKLINFGGYVKLRTLSRDDRSGEFIKETTLVKWKDLPRDAVKCTGERHAYCLDLVEKSQWYLDNHYRNLGQRDAGFNASDAYLYMQSNKLDNALAIKWNMISRTNPIKYAIIGLVILLVGYIVMLRVM